MVTDSVRTAKAPERPSSVSTDDGPKQDPWRAFGYIVAGVVCYGALGAGLDWWLGTRFLVAIGIVAGAALGIYMTWARFSQPEQRQNHQPDRDTSKTMQEDQ